MATIDLRKLAARVVTGFTSQIRKKRLVTANNLPDKLLIRGDESRIEQVLTNLISNAVKFNKEGGTITLGCEDSSGALRAFVEDSGIGIPEKDIPRIFERFYRVDKARSREMGGTGLGLSIVKHIVELHGGQVGVESTEGVGAKFWFNLPR